ncbi:uncharacterized protein BO97DRAFT_222714 [Aspergillus homomorphus CBS 101889]|uniref:RING-type domain-containing protein n=1 Tax=Aspergillus homomorphus (strain CBS 101889) TaxID=1450537 RepID=A0A395HLL4_ASPHC|nr:hypothetical protein BO97DRAFT_222714 [Aspergillus homomorphus CBS 101889]RAL08369.1 hypothetical protein BO97DRAFT_222714 [Aspergillus homomorphus CBS 101889]
MLILCRLVGYSAICLERLKVDEKATTDTSNLPLADPKPAWIDPRCSNRGPLANSDLEMGLGDWRRGSLPVSLSSSSDMNDAQQTKQPGGDDVLVLNRCNHVFHASCLVLWVEQHRYRCPICQASLKHGS